ncbi:MAG: transposase [Flavobacteriaceae bacterium]|nr:transposase [Flavobacteriaceae bacterium]
MKSYKNANDPQRSFVSVYVEKHSKKNHFFNDVKKMINWAEIDKALKKVYTVGLKERGAKAYSPLLLFKMHLISIWYDISDAQTEFMVNDSLSAMKFCNLKIEDDIPGHSTLSRFKRELTDQKSYKEIIEKIDLQLSKHQVKIVKGRAKVDAKLIPI